VNHSSKRVEKKEKPRTFLCPFIKKFISKLFPQYERIFLRKLALLELLYEAGKYSVRHWHTAVSIIS